MSFEAEVLLLKIQNLHKNTGETVFYTTQLLETNNIGELIGELSLYGFVDYTANVAGKFEITEKGINYVPDHIK